MLRYTPIIYMNASQPQRLPCILHPKLHIHHCRLTRGIYHKIEKTCTKGQEKTTHDIKQKEEENKARKQCKEGMV